MLLKNDLIVLLHFPETPKPPETPQGKQFAHLPAEADNLKPKRDSKRHMHLEGHQKVPFHLNSPIIWKPECFFSLQTCSLRYIMGCKPNTSNRPPLVTSLGQDSKGITGVTKLSPGVLQTPHLAAWGSTGPAGSCPGS